MACGGGGGGDGETAEQGVRGSTIRQVASALTSNLSIQDGHLELGPMPEPTARDIVLADVSLDGALDPDGVVIFGFDVDSPSGALPQEMLLQFESADEHIQAPVMASGANNHVEFEIDVGGGVCDDLCNVEHRIELTVAVVVEGGEVSSHATIEVVLDCRDAGSANACVMVDEQGEPVSGTRPSGSGGSGGSSGSGGSGSTSTDVPAGVDVQAGCEAAIMNCPTVFDGSAPPDPMAGDSGQGGPTTLTECTQGIACLFENADDQACTDMLTEIMTCLEQMGSACMGCASLFDELDKTAVCDASDTACFGSDGGMDPGGAGMTGGGTGGMMAGGAPDCAGLPVDKPVSQFTEMEASTACRCSYEAAMPMDVPRVECTGRAVYAASTPSECQTMVEACVNGDPMVCDGTEQLMYLSTCTGTLAELQTCFEAALAWSVRLTCDQAGTDPCLRPDYPQCLVTMCGACSGAQI